MPLLCTLTVLLVHDTVSDGCSEEYVPPGPGAPLTSRKFALGQLLPPVGEGVAVGLCVGVLLATNVGVVVGVTVGVRVAVAVGVLVGVWVGVAVLLSVGVLVDIADGVALGDGPTVSV